MIGTLITNSEVNKQFIQIAKQFYDLASDSEMLDYDNLNKFNDYFCTENAVLQFKADFVEIYDGDKNDTLYYDIHSEAKNQFFIHLTVEPISSNHGEVAITKYEQYIREKNIKTISMKRIAKKMQGLLNNYKAAKKTDPHYHLKNQLNSGKFTKFLHSY